jgi:arylsulfatase A-like enzyme
MLLCGGAAAVVAASVGVSSRALSARTEVEPPSALRSTTRAGKPPTRRPNVIVISFDDLGWNGFGCYGNDFHETPHIDRLAAEGMRFTQAYAAAPVCSPTRAALMTGLYPARTIPEPLARRGYRSALIGKWHLTEDYSGPYRKRKGNPYAHGFDDVLLSEEQYIGLGDGFFPYSFMPSVTRGRPQQYLTNRIARDSASWITRHADRPFFLHVSNYAVHSPWEASERLIAKYRRKKRTNPQFRGRRYVPLIAAMVERCDRQVGRIVQAVGAAGIADNTLILVTSDNGGDVNATNRPLRGGKMSLYEGGIRVPLIAFWPGTVPAGTTSNAVVSTLDVLPTIQDLADAGDWSGLDGVSLTGVLLRQQQLTRETYWYYPHTHSTGVPSAAVRSGRYKLIKKLSSGKIELYDIVDDPRERTNLADLEPTITRRLHRRLRRHIRQMRQAAPA